PLRNGACAQAAAAALMIGAGRLAGKAAASSAVGSRGGRAKSIAAVMPVTTAGVTPRNPAACSAFALQNNPAGQEPLMRTSLLTTLAFAGLALAACNTIGGAGKDMSSAGKAVTKTANDAKK
ncbi:MAG: hypothetical protein RL490_1866, partial [Pseudomonadota bacterium]